MRGSVQFLAGATEKMSAVGKRTNVFASLWRAPPPTLRPVMDAIPGGCFLLTQAPGLAHFSISNNVPVRLRPVHSTPSSLRTASASIHRTDYSGFPSSVCMTEVHSFPAFKSRFFLLSMISTKPHTTPLPTFTPRGTTRNTEEALSHRVVNHEHARSRAEGDALERNLLHLCASVNGYPHLPR